MNYKDLFLDAIEKSGDVDRREKLDDMIKMIRLPDKPFFYLEFNRDDPIKSYEFKYIPVSERSKSPEEILDIFVKNKGYYYYWDISIGMKFYYNEVTKLWLNGDPEVTSLCEEFGMEYVCVLEALNGRDKPKLFAGSKECFPNDVTREFIDKLVSTINLPGIENIYTATEDIRAFVLTIFKKYIGKALMSGSGKQESKTFGFYIPEKENISELIINNKEFVESTMMEILDEVKKMAPSGTSVVQSAVVLIKDCFPTLKLNIYSDEELERYKPKNIKDTNLIF